MVTNTASETVQESFRKLIDQGLAGAQAVYWTAHWHDLSTEDVKRQIYGEDSVIEQPVELFDIDYIDGTKSDRAELDLVVE